MHDDNFLSPSFFLAYLKLECLLAMGFTIFTFKAHRRNRNSVSKLLWPNRQKVFTFRVYNTTKKYSHCYSYHQLKLYTISPHPLLFNLGLLQFGVKWQIIFFSLCVSWQFYDFNLTVFSAVYHLFANRVIFVSYHFEILLFFQIMPGCLFYCTFVAERKVMVQPPYVYFLYIPVKERTITGVRVVNISFLCGVHQVESGKWKVGNFW